MRKRIYIAGPMTGLPDFNRDAFFDAANHIEEVSNLVPIHTAWLRSGMTWEEYMEIAYDFLAVCDLVCVLPGWEESLGASEEVETAKRIGIPVVELCAIQEEFGE